MEPTIIQTAATTIVSVLGAGVSSIGTVLTTDIGKVVFAVVVVSVAFGIIRKGVRVLRAR